jgi:tripeptide aminopeptidase
MADSSLRSACLDRFLRYVTFDTQSDENSTTVSFDGEAARAAEASRVGAERDRLKDAAMDEHGYVFATIPADEQEGEGPVVGFIAHVDTSPEMPGVDVKPIVHKNYQGQGPRSAGRSEAGAEVQGQSAARRSDRQRHRDGLGATLLGADNKAGVAEIVAAAST